MTARRLHLVIILSLAVSLSGWLAVVPSTASCERHASAAHAARHACCPQSAGARHDDGPMSPYCAWRCSRLHAAVLTPTSITPPASTVLAAHDLRLSDVILPASAPRRATLPAHAPPARRFALLCIYRC